MLKYIFQNEAIPCMKPGIELENGYLIVEARKPDGSPLPNATVRIESEDREVNIKSKVLKTDANGRTETITVPAPARRYSLLETSIVVPFTRLTIRVEYPGYYTNVYKHAQVFARTTTTQTSRMTPLPAGMKNVPGLEKVYEIPAQPLK